MAQIQKMSSFKRYMFKAYYDWFADNDVVPHLVVDTTVPGVVVPQQFIKDNRIVLSIYSSAIAAFNIDRRGISFMASFRGRRQEVVVPYAAMLELVVVDNCLRIPVGMIFQQLDDAEEEIAADTDDDSEDQQQDDGGFRTVPADGREQDSDGAPEFTLRDGEEEAEGNRSGLLVEDHEPVREEKQAADKADDDDMPSFTIVTEPNGNK